MSVSGSASNVPVSAYVHMAITAVNLAVLFANGFTGGAPRTYFLVLLVLAALVVMLYVAFIRDRKNWARLLLALITLPPGLLLFMKGSSEYVQTYDPSLVTEAK